jgi:serine/threonine-protein kinase
MTSELLGHKDQQGTAVQELVVRFRLLSQQGRPPSLGELCRDHPQLVGEVEKALRVLERPDQPVQDLASTPNSADLVTMSLHDVVPGLGPRYAVEMFLGQGAMAAVYRAHDNKLGRTVAVKVIRPECVTAARRPRLEAEVKAAAQLDHPHIVKAFEVGECHSSDEAPLSLYLSLEYVPGGSLASRLRPGEALAVPEAARLVALLARAMQHAHERGVVHRDLKPDNVLLGPPTGLPGMDTEMGCPRISDFGLPRQVEVDETQEAAITGTPPYMAPEQAEARPDVGPPADVYALGALLYRLLTGHPALESSDAVSFHHKVIHEPPQPPTRLKPDLPPELEALCLQCLNKGPEQRPPAGELARRLEAFQPGPEAAAPAQPAPLPGGDTPAGPSGDYVGFTIKIDRPFHSYTEQEQSGLFAAIGELLRAHRPTQTIDARGGSVLLPIRLHRTEAERLHELIEAGALREHHVTFGYAAPLSAAEEAAPTVPQPAVQGPEPGHVQTMGSGMPPAAEKAIPVGPPPAVAGPPPAVQEPEPAPVQPRPSKPSNLLLNVILPIAGIAVVLLLLWFVLGPLLGESPETKQMQEFFEAVARRRRTLPMQTVRSMVKPGQAMKEVELLMGRPERRVLPPNGSPSDEHAEYQCSDGAVMVIYEDGKVRAVTESREE